MSGKAGFAGEADAMAWRSISLAHVLGWNLESMDHFSTRATAAWSEAVQSWRDEALPKKCRLVAMSRSRAWMRPETVVMSGRKGTLERGAGALVASLPSRVVWRRWLDRANVCAMRKACWDSVSQAERTKYFS
jgi:hypothetical protein